MAWRGEGVKGEEWKGSYIWRKENRNFIKIPTKQQRQGEARAKEEFTINGQSTDQVEVW